MTTDADIARLVDESYTARPTWQRDDVRAVLSGIEEGAALITIPGTTDDVRTWLRDAEFWPLYVKGLGLAPKGFMQGAQSVLEQIIHDVPTDPFWIGGHSLGGAIGLDLAALLVQRGRKVERVVTYGAPRAGRTQMADVLAHVDIREYHNGNDPVPDVPPAYYPMRARLHIGAAALDPIDRHHMAAYRAALTQGV